MIPKTELIYTSYRAGKQSRDRKSVSRGAEDLNWIPHPVQRIAWESPAFETLFGGAGGGGKTNLSCALSLYGPHHHILFLRREAAQLSEIKFQLTELLPPGTRYGGGNIVRLSDRLIELGGCQHESDWTRYKGRAHSLKIFDELSEFSEAQYLKIIGWCRDPHDPCRVLGTSNPPTSAEGQWVKKRWRPWLDKNHPNPAKSGEIRWFLRLSSAEEIEVDDDTPQEINGKLVTPKSRTFVRSLVTDNPVMMESGYEDTLFSLPEPLRSQLLYGDWDAGAEDDAYQICPTAWVKAAQARWTSEPPCSQPDVIGIDVARGGDDQTALAYRYNNWLDVDKIPGKETPDGPAVVTWFLQQTELRGINVNDTVILVDIIGVGGSVYDILNSLGYDVRAVNVAKASRFKDRSRKLGMKNMRAALWWKCRELLDPTNQQYELDEFELMLPDRSDVLADLVAPLWKLQLSNIVVEPKKEVKKRLGRSPDLADAIVMVLFGLHYNPVWD